MYSIIEKIWAYTNDSRDPQKIDASMVRNNTSNVHDVNTFSDLVSKVATLSFLNPKMFLLFRGQGKDYRTLKGNIALFPTIYRSLPGKNVLPKTIRKGRFAELESKVAKLRNGYPRHTLKFGKELSKLKRNYELCWAILQHYKIIDTPYLDFTTSLRVASSFALLNSGEGFIYIIGVPYPTGTITHVVDEDLKLVRLQAACPPSAKRPHFQEGFLVGSCYVNAEESRVNQNLSRRLITKFHIPDKEEFWTEGLFDPIPPQALLPTNDKNFDWLK